MRKFTVRELTLAAVVAAVYFVLCYFGNIFQLTFGPVQVRLGEALTVLPFLFPATALAAWMTAKMPRWYLAALPPIVMNALLLPPMWAFAEAGAVNSVFWASYWFNMWTFVVGEAIACYVLGTVLLKGLSRVKFFRPMIPAVHLAHL